MFSRDVQRSLLVLVLVVDLSPGLQQDHQRLEVILGTGRMERSVVPSVVTAQQRTGTPASQQNLFYIVIIIISIILLLCEN